jgi:SAM-dependent methyltransferase
MRRMTTTRGAGSAGDAGAGTGDGSARIEVELPPWDGLIAPEWIPAEIDTETAHPSRIYDFLLGGKNNFAADRAVAEQLMRVRPEIRDAARANRAFLGRAVRFAVDSGIRQFLDIGTGIPAEGNTHEVAQALAPECTVAYVDFDPMVLVHARALLATEGRGRTTVLQGDLRDPRAILDDPQVRAAVDFARPVALLLVAVLHFVGDHDRPAEIVATLRDALAPGSLLVLSHGVYHPDQLDELDRFTKAYNKSAAVAHIRRPEEVEAFFAGFDLVEPGLVQVSDWRPDPGTVPLPPQAGFRGGVGFVRGR